MAASTRVVVVAAGAGVQGDDQHEVGRERARGHGPGNGHRAVFQRLAEHFERLAVELRQLVEEEHGFMGQGADEFLRWLGEHHPVLARWREESLGGGLQAARHYELFKGDGASALHEIEQEYQEWIKVERQIDALVAILKEEELWAWMVKEYSQKPHWYTQPHGGGDIDKARQRLRNLLQEGYSSEKVLEQMRSEHKKSVEAKEAFERLIQSGLQGREEINGRLEKLADPPAEQPVEQPADPQRSDQ